MISGQNADQFYQKIYSANQIGKEADEARLEDEREDDSIEGGKRNKNHIRYEKEVEDDEQNDMSKSTLAATDNDDNQLVFSMSSLSQRPKSYNIEDMKDDARSDNPVRDSLDEGGAKKHRKHKRLESKKRSKELAAFVLAPSERKVKFDSHFGHFTPLPAIGQKH